MRSSVVAAIALCAAGTVLAQPPAPPTAQQRAAHEAQRMERLATLLDLNDGQKAQVQTVLQEERAKAMTQFQQQRSSGTRPTPEQMKAMHDQLQAETLQKLSTVLSASQLKKFQLLEEDEHRPFGRPFGGGPGHGGPPGPPPPPDTQN